MLPQSPNQGDTISPVSDTRVLRWLLTFAAPVVILIMLAVMLTDAVEHRLLVSCLALTAFLAALAFESRFASREGPQPLDQANMGGESSDSVPGVALSPRIAPTVNIQIQEADRPARTHVGTHLQVSVLSRPKHGGGPDENEDSVSVDPEHGLVAVSDGASGSICAAQWARKLTSDFLAERPEFTPEGIRAFLENAARGFTEVALIFDDDSDGGDAPYWAADAAREGAFATFLGFRAVREENDVSWQAAAVGDSVVLHMRKSTTGPRLVEGFPIESSGGFTGSPILVGTTAARAGSLPSIRLASGYGRVTDQWLLLTDEVAKWALRRDEMGMPVWTLLLEGRDADLAQAVASAYRSGEMGNDDLTVVRVAAAII